MNTNTTKSGIYIITNVINGKQYVGSAVNLHYRIRNHKTRLKHNKHKNIKLQLSYNKYGEKAFAYSVIEIVDEISNLLIKEQYYIDTLKPIYNIMQIAGSNLGYKHSEKTIAKCVAANIRRTGTHHNGRNGRVFKFDLLTGDVPSVHSSAREAASKLNVIKGSVKTAGTKIAESIKRDATAYGYKWQYEKNLAQIKVDELLEILNKTISSQAIDTSIEGSETT